MYSGCVTLLPLWTSSAWRMLLSSPARAKSTTAGEQSEELVSHQIRSVLKHRERQCCCFLNGPPPLPPPHPPLPSPVWHLPLRRLWQRGECESSRPRGELLFQGRQFIKVSDKCRDRKLEFTFQPPGGRPQRGVRGGVFITKTSNTLFFLIS